MWKKIVGLLAILSMTPVKPEQFTIDQETPIFSFLVSMNCWSAAIDVTEKFQKKELLFSRPFSGVYSGTSGYGFIAIKSGYNTGSFEIMQAISEVLSNCSPDGMIEIKRDGTEWKELQKLVEQVEAEGKEIVDISLSPISVIVYTRSKKENRNNHELN